MRCATGTPSDSVRSSFVPDLRGSASTCAGKDWSSLPLAATCTSWWSKIYPCSQPRSAAWSPRSGLTGLLISWHERAGFFPGSASAPPDACSARRSTAPSIDALGTDRDRATAQRYCVPAHRSGACRLPGRASVPVWGRYGTVAGIVVDSDKPRFDSMAPSVRVRTASRLEQQTLTNEVFSLRPPHERDRAVLV